MATLIAAAIAQLRRHAPFDAMEEADIELLASRLKLAYFPAETVILESKSGALQGQLVLSLTPPAAQPKAP